METVSAQAQEEWTLRQCIEYAIEQNVLIRQTENAAQQSEVEVNTARWSRLPNLSGQAGQSWNWGRTQTAVADESTGEYTTKFVSVNSHGTNMSLSTNMPLFTGFQIPHQYELAKLNLKAAVADLDQAREELAIQVTQAYLQALFCGELHTVAVGQVALSRQQLERITQLGEVGKASAAEVAEARARLAQDELQAVQSLNDHRLALLDLSQLIELDTPEGFTLAQPDTLFTLQPLTPPDEVFQTAMLSKPSVQAARYRLEGSHHSIRVAQSAYYPQLSFGGSLGTNYYSTIDRNFSQQMEDNFSKYVGFSLSVPLFNRLATRNRVRIARLQQANYSLQLDHARKVLYKEIQQAWYNATAAESKYASSHTAMQSSQEAFNLMSRKYDNGQANAVEYNEAKQKLMKAQSDELQARYDYLFRTKILDFYQGKAIE